jgi:hypothetical protein
MAKTTITLDPKAKVIGKGKNLYAVSVTHIDDDFGDSDVTLRMANSAEEIEEAIYQQYGEDEEGEMMDRDDFDEMWQIAITLVGKVSQ